jgi:hypothetical protein
MRPTAFSLDMRIQPAPRRWAVRPFATAGFDRLRVHIDEEQPEDEVRPALHFGYGADFDLAGVPLRIEGMHRRFHEGTPAGRQMHYVIMGGVRIPID